MGGPRIGYGRPLVARNMPNHSTIPDSKSVITLGHKANQPLIRPSSDLSDGFEPHGLILPAGRTPRISASAGECCTGVYLGVVRLGGYREGAIPGNPAYQIEAYLMNIKI